VIEVGLQNILSLGNDISHDFEFIVGFRLPFFNGDGIFRATGKACPKTVAQEIPDKAGFPVNDLQCSFRAVCDAQAATVAFFLIDSYDLPFHMDPRFRNHFLITLK
jgi:hypothetical protein